MKKPPTCFPWNLTPREKHRYNIRCPHTPDACGVCDCGKHRIKKLISTKLVYVISKPGPFFYVDITANIPYEGYEHIWVRNVFGADQFSTQQQAEEHIKYRLKDEPKAVIRQIEFNWRFIPLE